ncbi:MAG: hypothetical protein CM15mP49_27990 [Actinomycetota bacterium]|nr:MAG: hypothetical protein CM15mP49_27990 [Actinomycetota bacterium]
MTDHPNIRSKSTFRTIWYENVTIHYGLTQDELFFAAIENDKGRVSIDGDSNQQKHFQLL